MDYMTGLPECNGHDAILVFVDMKSKDYIAIPCSKTLDSEGQARLFIKHVVVPHSLPKRIWSDRGPTLVSSFTKEVYRQMGIEGNPSTAYHPQTDGQTERMNQEIQTYLRIFINHKQDDWVEWLPLAEFAYRCRVHASTGMSPFFMTHGHEPNTGVETLKDGINESAKQFAERMQRIGKQAAQALEIAREAMKRHYDKHRRPAREYKTGDYVYIDAQNFPTDRPNKKLEDKRYGPFRVEEKIGASAYRLKLPPKWKLRYPVFNEVLLTPAHDPEFPNQGKTSREVPTLLEPEREVEAILDSKIVEGSGRSRKVHYLVQWCGLTRADRKWVPSDTDELRMDDAKKLIVAFYAANKFAPRIHTRFLLSATNKHGQIITYDTDCYDFWTRRYKELEKMKSEQ
ncbi:hypothetical protein GSI_05635 [Ganoderma sinense ZZ0214-1]|uniref:Integrase catalytic domain-containing protein n=1 Tax=Ganoderma sinense ZZ0214-1 TaxID=1077348 RepID=A0A2G8SF48_9APHY|nr:hypothetical protein GSI_05635 [Ganoderma sinense ZZ0214-1]